MKPTLQFSRPRWQSKTPVTDWSFQLSAPDMRGGAMPFHPGVRHATRRPGFHTLSQRFFSIEASREARFEGMIFGAIGTLATWPIAVVAQTALMLLK